MLRVMCGEMSDVGAVVRDVSGITLMMYVCAYVCMFVLTSVWA